MKLIHIPVLMLSMAGFSATADVARSQLTYGISDREPIDNIMDEVVGEASQVTTLYYFTALQDLQGEQVVHRWYREGELMAEVSFTPTSDYWRTWSSKRLLPRWGGDWQVQVWHGDTMIDSKTFRYTITPQRYLSE
ncbi:DUF2914 domain-containing protein [Bowmanella dokdonensis]|uniref:DUF2914 domain-containing protein n=1 Tax=Bowmanella dokdonensis TaxID=751969 RepID=A0A939DNB3_9ALTE|nr:DUF2914 domain-containing protein [Bowmanella dokdonensis]MBN7825668.1 DUF2914 domain-containing protein [Bowmanella dokdonensis]